MNDKAAVPLAPPAPLTHRRVLTIAVPIVLSNVTVPILGAVDTGVVGQLGEAAPIGAVALGAIVLSTVYWIFGFLRMGTVGLVGQAEGAGDSAEVSALLTRALMIAASGGVLVILLHPLIFYAAFASDPTTPEVEGLARSYISIRIWSAPCAIAVYALTGWLVAMERTAAVFWIQLTMNGVNVLLDLWFVLGLGWGVQGVAAATVIAEVVGAGLGLWFCRAAFAGTAWCDWTRVFDRIRLIRMALVNSDILIRSALLMATLYSFQFFSAGFGEVTLAANAVLIQFTHIVAYALDGFAFAAESLVARAMGRRDPGRVRRSAALTAFWGLVTVVAMALGFALIGPLLIDAMTTAEEVRAEARRYLPWTVAAPLVGWAAWMLDGIFIGATRSADMRNMMIVSTAIYAVAVSLLPPVWGNHGLWAALLISYAARGITLALRYPALERSARAG